ncbi:ECF transporter S component [Pediococcus claussenii]|uniref:Riboflavin transporter n=1 Tax=Pediococcus claussenii (strain ATCC BAA-344 / DSM 14800 / JCM 18046 / KCTC 3811 / LMG 21948 / P06) TaxID=701521 RepID=G8PA75_PEDCP|nr:ECF transporter S component [Pediococcus claussenii]AEV94514.1 riboflavin transporter RibU [Pediococcus claussenii ATCC BAA-344]ANZ69731.1 hypothetical protein AYR57_05105 [Pediococcus claussenii]ANZ71548.1 hypothetical protein AYR58_05110 [Pediococcus claussenii]KRN19779.1 ribU protein [Pediococcus claussenii]
MGVSSIKRLVAVAMLAAISFVLLFIGFPVLPGFSFLKVDFANLPILIGAVAFGPVWGAVTAVLGGLLDVMLKDGGPVGMLGVAANLLATLSYVLPIYYWTKNSAKESGKIRVRKLMIGIGVGTILMTAIMSLANLFVLLPIYMKLASFQVSVSTLNMVVYGVIPFNLIKGILVGLVIAILFYRLLPIVKRG